NARCHARDRRLLLGQAGRDGVIKAQARLLEDQPLAQHLNELMAGLFRPTAPGSPPLLVGRLLARGRQVGTGGGGPAGGRAVGLVVVWWGGVVKNWAWWLTGLDGIAAVLAIGYAALVTDESGPIAATSGPALIGLGLLALFIVGLATSSSGWLTWFTFGFAC